MPLQNRVSPFGEIVAIDDPNGLDIEFHEDEFDYTAFDTLIPHPAYAVQGWVSFVNPGSDTIALAATLMDYASQVRHL